MIHSPVILSTLTALFSAHFMGDATDGGEWRCVPRGIAGSPAVLWYEAHGCDSLREQFWSEDRNALVAADETEARSLLTALESEFRAWLVLSGE